MGLPKGRSNNLKGRPKGVPNKTTADMRELITKFVGDNLEGMQSDFDQLEPKERLMYLERLLGYALPKFQAIPTKEDPTLWEMGEIVIEL